MGTSSDDAFDDYLDAVLVGGREERELVLVDYMPAWTTRFASERVRIVEALGEAARRAEHVGSTAVPGLAAKPIVDILVAVDDPDDEYGYLDAMEGAGYYARAEGPVIAHMSCTRRSGSRRPRSYGAHLPGIMGDVRLASLGRCRFGSICSVPQGR